MDIKKCTGLAGEPRDYYLYPKAEPPYEQSDYIEEVLLDRFRYHSGEGDMWPMTWAKDGCMYCGAGDNKGCPTNIWKLTTMRYAPEALTNTGNWSMAVSYTHLYLSCNQSSEYLGWLRCLKT